VASEIFDMLLTAPLQAKRDEWMWDVGERIRRLESQDPVRLSQLTNDATFTSVLLRSTQAALRANTRGKIELLKGAVAHSAAGCGIASDLQVIFVRYLDELTESHVALLSALVTQERLLGTLRAWEVLYEIVKGTTSLKLTHEEFQLLGNDLRARLLLRISERLEDFDDIYHGPELITSDEGEPGSMIRVTDIGRQFLAFVELPPEFT
jgi:hypothetical protein